MSVARHWTKLELHRIPKRLRTVVPGATGSDSTLCWRIGDGPFASGALDLELSVRVDSDPHGLLEPATLMPLEQYESALAKTQAAWIVDEAAQ
jgi:hypothetical protein